MKQPKQLTSCPHCGARVWAKVRSIKVKPLRRCPRCGRGYAVTQSQEVAA